MRRVISAGVLLTALFLTVGTVFASGGGVKLCVSEKEGGAIKTPKKGACSKGYKLTELGAEGKEGHEGPEGPEGEEGRQGPAGPVHEVVEALNANCTLQVPSTKVITREVKSGECELKFPEGEFEAPPLLFITTGPEVAGLSEGAKESGFWVDKYALASPAVANVMGAQLTQ